jgi:hypothetical protein
MEDIENGRLRMFEILIKEAFSDELTAIEILSEFIKIGFITDAYLLN